MKPHNLIYDTVVIGGGLAGSTAAFHLARKGCTTLLLEEKPGPHHKVCGEFLSNETLPYLTEMGIDLKQLGASQLSQAKLYAPHRSFSFTMPKPAYGISRYQLDEVLLMQAMQQGAEIKRGFRVVDIEKSENLFLIRTAHETFKTRAVFLACGKHEISSFHHRSVYKHNLLGLKMHYRLSKKVEKKLQDNVELYFFKGGYLGLSLVEDGITNLCMVIDSSRYQINGGFEATLNYIKNQNVFFMDILNDAQPCFTKPLTVAQVPYGYLKSDFSQKNIYFLGDQFGVIPSFSGSGMALALMSARHAAASFTNPSHHPDYAKHLIKVLKPSMRLAYPIHLMSQSPWIADGMIRLLKCFPALSQKIYQKTRIAVNYPSYQQELR